MGLKELIASDLARYAQTYKLRGQPYSRGKILWESLLFKSGFKAVLLYRISHWLYRRGRTYLAWYCARVNVKSTGAEIEFNAEIGPGLFIAHPVGIVIGRGVKMGENATIFQGVTFGARDWHPAEIGRFPRVGDNCCFFAQAVVIGGIEIGDYCLVAAQALVNKDMPAGALAAGVPARITAGRGKEKIQSWTGGPA